ADIDMSFFISEDIILLFFFFQAEDGIRDGHVTGVQTCALPISDRQTSKSQTTTGRSACDGSTADSADRGSSPVASTAGATRSDRRGVVLPPFLVVLAFLLRPSSLHKSRSRSWPSVEARDLAPPDVRARRAWLFGGPASYVETLLSVAPDGWADSSLLPRRNDRKSATNGYT